MKGKKSGTLEAEEKEKMGTSWDPRKERERSKEGRKTGWFSDLLQSAVAGCSYEVYNRYYRTKN